ncbi:MAG: hypothetical protein WCI79_01020 [Candidatus Saccharibacteria bacterium]
MINLLPNSEKREIHAARTNVVLIDYIVFLAIAIVFLALACLTAYFILNDIRTRSETTIKSIEANQSLMSGVQTGDVGVTIATAESILARQISYSNIITDIGSRLPYGVVVDKISLNESLLNAPLEVEFRGRATSVAPELIANLQKSTIFSSPTCKLPILSAGNSADYPVLITCELPIVKGANI